MSGSVVSAYPTGSKHGAITILGCYRSKSEGWRKIHCSRCDRTLERQLALLNKDRDYSEDRGVERACRECMRREYRRIRERGRHVVSSPRDYELTQPRQARRFRCNECCDQLHRDCVACKRVGVPEALPRATGWERTEMVTGRRL